MAAKDKKAKKIGGFYAEFKKFIMRGNVLDMAVGVIVGGAFTAIVTALSDHILKPVINWILALILGANSLSEIYTVLRPVYTTGEGGQQLLNLEQSIYIDWGAFINAIINFILIAFVLFCIVKAINSISEASRLAVSEEGATRRNKLKEYRKSGLSYREAEAKIAEEIKAAEEAKAAQDKADAEKAAAEAEAKATENTRLLAEIVGILKEKKK